MIKPKIVWTYLNIADPLVAWETYRGVLISPDCYTFEDMPSISFWQLKFLRNMHSVQSANEVKLEIIRQKFYPYQVSRFRGFYYFEDRNTAIEAAQMWRINYFNNFCLAEVGIASNSIYSKLDSNWITLYADKLSDNDEWIHLYWQGKPCPNFEKPIWELLVITRGLIYDNDLRMRVYEKIKNDNPTKLLPMLEQARLAAYLGSDLGHCSPRILQETKTRFKVIDVMDMRDAKNQEYLDKLKSYVENPANKKYINFNDLRLIERYNVFSVPDMSNRQFVFEIDANLAKDFDIQKMAHNFT